jgi:hypothetical protein
MSFQYYRTELIGLNFLLMYFKISYDFTIRFYDPSLYCIFCTVSKS